MISIFIMYSPDRIKALRIMLSFLDKMPFYKECQKTLVVDGRCNLVLEDFEVIEIPRISYNFNWSRAWNAGVYTAKYPVIWYLDSDRLLPPQYIQMLKNYVKEDVFVFTSNHYLMLSEISPELCRDFVYREQREGILAEESFLGKIKYETRYLTPTHFPGKNVMSGNTAFLKSTFEKLGGVDKWYEGHGAFADNDFHSTASMNGCKFVDLKVPELHYYHEKREDEQALSDKELKKLSLDNYIYYCVKWNIPPNYPTVVAANIEIEDPTKYVRKKMKEFKSLLKG